MIRKISFMLFLNVAVLFLHAQNYIPRQGKAPMVVTPVLPLKATAFPLNDVRVTGGIFKQARDLDKDYLLALQPDRLLHRFHKNAGLSPKDAVYGGWESESLSGHTLGHYLSAAAMMYAGTGDKQLKERVDYIVRELAICQKARNTGYVGAIPGEDSLWAQVSRGDIRSAGFDLNGIWSPWYTVHKVFAGLMDAYIYCGNEQALQVVTKLSDWVLTTLAGLNDAQIQQMLRCEFGGMNEAMVNMYALTGKKKYLEGAGKFYHKAILDSLAMQIDVMVGKHSNTNIPKVIGSIRNYQLTGNSRDSSIAHYFWKTIVNYHTYVNGGNSNYEYLGPEGQLNNRLSDNNTETCNSYNMLKLTAHLFTVNPSAELGDYYERTLYNHILASQERDSGMMCYFVPLRMGGQKSYSTKFNSFWCCVGSGIENHAKYNEAIYFRGADGGLFVNLFIPSTLQWKEKEIQITQTTNFPEENNTRLKITANQSSAWPLYIRNAWYTKNKIQIWVNGNKVIPTLNNNGYWEVKRLWRNNDEVSIETTMSLRTESMPDNDKRIAFFYGPILLAGDLGKTRPDPVFGTPVLQTSNTDISEWLKSVKDSPLVFQMNGIGKPFDTRLKPFYQTNHHFYSVYWDYFSEGEWKAREEEYIAEKQRQVAIEKRTIDLIRIGEMQPERDHFLKASNNSYVSDAIGRTGREARSGGFFEFELKTDPKVQNILLLTYIGDDKNRQFDLLVDGQKLTTVHWPGGDTGRFYDFEYSIPLDWTTGQNKVTIKIDANSKSTAGRVFGSRMMRANN